MKDKIIQEINKEYSEKVKKIDEAVEERLDLRSKIEKIEIDWDKEPEKAIEEAFEELRKESNWAIDMMAKQCEGQVNLVRDIAIEKTLKEVNRIVDKEIDRRLTELENAIVEGANIINELIITEAKHLIDICNELKSRLRDSE